MASGVQVLPDVGEKFIKLKLKQEFKYIIYRISTDLKNIEVESTGAKDACYSEFCDNFADDNCRYGIFDYVLELKDGTKKPKILFVSWVPDTAPVKSKMLYAASKDALKKSLKEGISKEIQASDKSDLDIDIICQELIKSDRS